MEKFKILSEGFIFIDSEGRKALKAEALDEICEMGYFVSVMYKNKNVAASCPVNVQTYFDSAGAARTRAREVCLDKLNKGLK